MYVCPMHVRVCHRRLKAVTDEMINKLSVMGKRHLDIDWTKAWKMPSAQLLSEGGDIYKDRVREAYEKYLANGGEMPQSLSASGLSGVADAKTPAQSVLTGSAPDLTPDADTLATNAVGDKDVVNTAPPGTEPQAKAQVPLVPGGSIPDHASEAGIASTNAKGTLRAERESEVELVRYNVYIRC